MTFLNNYLWIFVGKGSVMSKRVEIISYKKLQESTWFVGFLDGDFNILDSFIQNPKLNQLPLFSH